VARKLDRKEPIVEWTVENRARTTYAMSTLLGRLGLQQYSFLVRPRAARCDVHVEYASTAGWNGTTLSLDAARLLAALSDEDAARELATAVKARLKQARYAANAVEARRAEGIALGRAWASDRADELRGAIDPADWPDFWDEAGAGPLPDDMNRAEQRELYELATSAARERWIEIVADERFSDTLEENRDEVEARAAALEAELRGSLPPDVDVGRDGSRVFLVLSDPGRDEKTVTSLSNAWRALHDWEEQRRAAS
jgi:hypothetical protein